MTTTPFPDTAMLTSDPVDIIYNTAIGRGFRAAITEPVLQSLRAQYHRNVPGTYQRGGFAFVARFHPITESGRSEDAEPMTVLVSVTPTDLIEVEVRRDQTGEQHALITEIYVGDLSRVIRALDYDGTPTLNPRYYIL